jgi:hypothetical protein
VQSTYTLVQLAMLPNSFSMVTVILIVLLDIINTPPRRPARSAQRTARNARMVHLVIFASPISSKKDVNVLTVVQKVSLHKDRTATHAMTLTALYVQTITPTLVRSVQKLTYSSTVDVSRIAHLQLTNQTLANVKNALNSVRAVKVKTVAIDAHSPKYYQMEDACLNVMMDITARTEFVLNAKTRDARPAPSIKKYVPHVL